MKELINLAMQGDLASINAIKQRLLDQEGIIRLQHKRPTLQSYFDQIDAEYKTALEQSRSISQLFLYLVVELRITYSDFNDTLSPSVRKDVKKRFSETYPALTASLENDKQNLKLQRLALFNLEQSFESKTKEFERFKAESEFTQNMQYAHLMLSNSEIGELQHQLEAAESKHAAELSTIQLEKEKLEREILAKISHLETDIAAKTELLGTVHKENIDLFKQVRSLEEQLDKSESLVNSLQSNSVFAMLRVERLKNLNQQFVGKLGGVVEDKEKSLKIAQTNKAIDNSADKAVVQKAVSKQTAPTAGSSAGVVGWLFGSSAKVVEPSKNAAEVISLSVAQQQIEKLQQQLKQSQQQLQSANEELQKGAAYLQHSVVYDGKSALLQEIQNKNIPEERPMYQYLKQQQARRDSKAGLHQQLLQNHVSTDNDKLPTTTFQYSARTQIQAHNSKAALHADLAQEVAARTARRTKK